MSNTRILLTAAAVGLLSMTQAQANDDVWFGAKGGTLGLGAEATWRLAPYLDLRAGLNGASYEMDGNEGGIDYDAELDMQTYYATANLRVPLSPFRLTSGVFSNGNELLLSSQETSSFEIGGNVYSAAEVGSLRGNVDFESTAPYLGIGADFRFANTLGLNIDLGVLWQGTPRVGLVADGPIAGDAAFQNELAAELTQLQDDLDKFKAFPVASAGFSWNF